jgi:hypothetical protein
MKRFALVLCFWLACIPVSAAQLAPSVAPVVVVYPFTVSGAADPEAGGRLAILFATRFADKGGITVKPATPGVTRTDFLAAAKALGADYYVTGYVTPLGDSVSLLDQVVSTYSGIVVWSNTVDVRTYAEASGQADAMSDAIIRHAGRTLAALDEPAPGPSATPAPSTSQPPNQGNFSKLFTRKGKQQSAPQPAPAVPPSSGTTTQTVASSPKSAAQLPTPGPAATHPPLPPPPPLPQGVSAVVVAVSGAASDSERAYASSQLASLIAKAGLGGALVANRSTTDVPLHAKDICAQNRAAAIFGGTLSLQRSGSAFDRGSSASFELLRYDCTGTVVERQQVQAQATGRSNTQIAIQHAVSKSFDALHQIKTQHS